MVGIWNSVKAGRVCDSALLTWRTRQTVSCADWSRSAESDKLVSVLRSWAQKDRGRAMSTVNERKAPGLVKQRQLWKKAIVSLCPTFKISRSTTLSTQPPRVWNTGSVKQVLGGRSPGGGWLFQGCGHCGFLLFCGCGECLKPQPLRCPVWMLCEYSTFGLLFPANQSLTAAAVRVWLALVAVSQTQNCFFSPPTFSSEDFCLKYYSLTLCRLTCLCKVEDKQICLSWRGAKGWVEKQGLTSILTDPPILKKAKV